MTRPRFCRLHRDNHCRQRHCLRMAAVAGRGPAPAAALAARWLTTETMFLHKACVPTGIISWGGILQSCSRRKVIDLLTWRPPACSAIASGYCVEPGQLHAATSNPDMIMRIIRSGWQSFRRTP